VGRIIVDLQSIAAGEGGSSHALLQEKG